MRRPGSVAPLHRGHEVGLPGDVEELLDAVVADGFMIHCCGPKTAPRALVASYEWDHSYVDLLTIQDFTRVITARVPTSGLPVDIFAPEIVVWAYEGPPQHALRALLNLAHPNHPDAPTTPYPAPASLQIPRAQQRPMSIQLPAPHRAGVRADRLATAIPTPGASAGTEQRPPAGRRLPARGPRRRAPGDQSATPQQDP